MDAAALDGSSTASCTRRNAFGAGLAGVPHSRGALAATIVLHSIGALVMIELFDAARVPMPPPIIVELLQPPEIRKEEPPPKKKPPEPKVELPPPEPPPPEPDVLPQPLPPVVPPVQRVRPQPIPEPVRPRVEPVPMQEPVVRRPLEPVNAPPPPVAMPRDPVREPPPAPILTAAAPTPVQVVEEPPRPDRPIAAPDAPRAPPREPPRRALPEMSPTLEVAAAPLPAADNDAIDVAPAPLPIGPVPEGPELSLDADGLKALYLRNPRPAYPAASRRLGEQGTVYVRAFITVDGDAKHVELRTSSGFPRLDRAALESIKTWKFVPAKKDDKPVEAAFVIPMKFSITK